MSPLIPENHISWCQAFPIIKAAKKRDLRTEYSEKASSFLSDVQPVLTTGGNTSGIDLPCHNIRSLHICIYMIQIDLIVFASSCTYRIDYCICRRFCNIEVTHLFILRVN